MTAQNVGQDSAQEWSNARFTAARTAASNSSNLGNDAALFDDVIVAIADDYGS